MILADILIYLAIIAAPCAICLLIYGIAHKVRQIRNADDSCRRIEANRAEYRAGWGRAQNVCDK